MDKIREILEKPLWATSGNSQFEIKLTDQTKDWLVSELSALPVSGWEGSDVRNLLKRMTVKFPVTDVWLDNASSVLTDYHKIACKATASQLLDEEREKVASELEEILKGKRISDQLGGQIVDYELRALIKRLKSTYIKEV